MRLTYLAADDIDLSSDPLDRIDEIVPAGDTVKAAENMWATRTSALDAAFHRRWSDDSARGAGSPAGTSPSRTA